MLLIACATSCPTDERCARCNGNTCELCHDGFLVNGVCQKQTLFVQKCLSYKIDGFCQKCENGYFVNQISGCSLITETSCAVYSLTETCTACFNNIKVFNNSCESKALCSAVNCEICNGSDTCMSCKAGFVLTTDKLCVAALASQSNCVALSDNGCLECKYGFFNKNGTCEKGAWFAAGGVLSAAIFGLISIILI